MAVTIATGSAIWLSYCGLKN